MTECFLKSLKVFFSNNINIKIYTDLLFDNFGSNCIIFLFFLNLGSKGKLILQAICNIPNFFFFKHGLCKIDPLEPILKVLEFLFFYFCSHFFYQPLCRGRKRIKRDATIIASIYTGSHNLGKNRYFLLKACKP